MCHLIAFSRLRSSPHSKNEYIDGLATFPGCSFMLNQNLPSTEAGFITKISAFLRKLYSSDLKLVHRFEPQPYSTEDLRNRSLDEYTSMGQEEDEDVAPMGEEEDGDVASMGEEEYGEDEHTTWICKVRSQPSSIDNMLTAFRLLETGQGSDLTITCRGKTFKVHSTNLDMFASATATSLTRSMTTTTGYAMIADSFYHPGLQLSRM